MLEYHQVPENTRLTISQLSARWKELFPKEFENKEVYSFIEYLIEVKKLHAVKLYPSMRGLSSSYNNIRDVIRYASGEIEIFGSSINSYEENHLLNNSKLDIDNSFTFDFESDDYPEELYIAQQAWYAVARKALGNGSTPKQRLIDWLKNSGYNLSDSQIDRIARVCNYNPRSGRPKKQSDS